MNLYFAPLEGITTRVYRQTHAAVFGGCDAYYAPFITPSENEKISRKGLRDILPEQNEGQNLRVQVLTNTAKSFLKFAEKIRAIGYREVNINLGCPFERVVRKGRGAGFLQRPEELERFLNEIFSESALRISVKTRIGFASGEEMERLLPVYNQYPLSLLIVHPRTRADFYKGNIDEKTFERIYQQSQNPLCYNGDVFSVENFKERAARFPELEGIMLGRGAVINPAVFREIKGGNQLKTEELVTFSEQLAENYFSVLQSETFTLHKLKEVWSYMIQLYPEEKRTAKGIKKAETLKELLGAVKCLPEK